MERKYNEFAIVGFVCSFFIGILGVIFSAIALLQINRNPSQKGRELAIAGLIIGIIETILEALVWFVWISLLI